MADIGIFPALPGLAWSVTKVPTFQTRIQRAVSGRELRALDYPFPLWQFSLVFDFLRDDPAAGYNELRTLAGFYLACRGAFSTFLYDDPTDDTVSDQVLGTGDASQSVFQLVRSFGGAPGFVEPIVAPNTVDAVYLNGLVQNPANYSVDPATGLLTFATPPTSGAVITADFSYYFRCRFIDDSYTFENFMAKLWSVKKMTFISVRP
ncbi:MAG TPA: DUF2460 domain-containing protein [Stellaceae bacterium]|jgi:uncharacterized protein (TIGR02217 family)